MHYAYTDVNRLASHISFNNFLGFYVASSDQLESFSMGNFPAMFSTLIWPGCVLKYLESSSAFGLDLYSILPLKIGENGLLDKFLFSMYSLIHHLIPILNQPARTGCTVHLLHYINYLRWSSIDSQMFAHFQNSTFAFSPFSSMHSNGSVAPSTVSPLRKYNTWLVVAEELKAILLSQNSLIQSATVKL